MPAWHHPPCVPPFLLSALPIIPLHHQKASHKVPHLIPISFSLSAYGKTWPEPFILLLMLFHSRGTSWTPTVPLLGPVLTFKESLRILCILQWSYSMSSDYLLRPRKSSFCIEECVTSFDSIPWFFFYEFKEHLISLKKHLKAYRCNYINKN